MELLLRNLSGLSSHKIMFSEQNLSAKLGTDILLLKERFREMQRNGYLEYIDGSLSSIKFLKHRDDRSVSGKYWHLFENIQKNKIAKWEEMKFYTREDTHCKMKLILSYFGEKDIKNCGKCSVCSQKNEKIFGGTIAGDILHILEQKPSTVEEIAIMLNFQKKEKILENLILLLDSGKVKMLNFRTYTVA